MKKYLLLVLLLAGMRATAQKIVLPLDADSTIVYQKVVRVKDTTLKREQLFNFAKIWFVRTFNNAKNGIQIDDPANGRLVAKASIDMRGVPHYPDADPTLTYSIEVLAKDGRYRYRIYDLGFTSVRMSERTASSIYSEYLHDNIWRDILQSKKASLKRYEATFISIDQLMTGLSDSLEKAINNQVENDKF